MTLTAQHVLADVPRGVPAHERLRDAAVALFAEQGFQATGIRDLAGAAGLSTASLYHYMETKEDLLVDIVEDSQRKLFRIAEQAVAEADCPGTRIAALTQIHVMTHALRPKHCLVSDVEMRSFSGERREYIVALRDEYERLWQAAIEDGCAQEIFTTVSMKLARISSIEMCTSVAYWYSPLGPQAVDELALAYTDLVLGLLRAQRRHRILRAEDLLMPGVGHYRNLVMQVWELSPR